MKSAFVTRPRPIREDNGTISLIISPTEIALTPFNLFKKPSLSESAEYWIFHLFQPSSLFSAKVYKRTDWSCQHIFQFTNRQWLTFNSNEDKFRCVMCIALTDMQIFTIKITSVIFLKMN